MFCKNCDQEIPDSLKFCKFCGAGANQQAVADVKSLDDNTFQETPDTSIPKQNQFLKLVKMFIRDMKNIKTISKKRRITYICAISAIVLVIAISASTGSRSSEAVTALYQTSALPSGMSQAISMGIYDDISIGQMIDYMFKNPKVSVSKGDSGSKIVEISGYHKVTIYGDYDINGQISFEVSENGTCSVESDPDEIMGIMQSIAVQLAYN